MFKCVYSVVMTIEETGHGGMPPCAGASSTDACNALRIGHRGMLCLTLLLAKWTVSLLKVSFTRCWLRQGLWNTKIGTRKIVFPKP